MICLLERVRVGPDESPDFMLWLPAFGKSVLPNTVAPSSQCVEGLSNLICVAVKCEVPY